MSSYADLKPRVEGQFKKRNPRLTENHSKWSTYIINPILVLFSAFLLYNVFKSVQITNEKIAVLDRAESEVSELRLKNIRIVLEREKVQSEVYIEREARNRLNYGKDGEIEFIIPEGVLESVDLTAYIDFRNDKNGSFANRQVSNIDLWGTFFIEGI